MASIMYRAADGTWQEMETVRGPRGYRGYPGSDGHSPVVTAKKSGSVTTISVDGSPIAQILDGEPGPQGDPGPAGADGNVTDFMIEEASIVNDGVAKLKILSTSLSFNESSGLFIPIASNSSVTGRKGNAALTCGKIDLGVKTAMCDGQGAEWSDDERRAALARLGCTVGSDGIVRYNA